MDEICFVLMRRPLSAKTVRILSAPYRCSLSSKGVDTSEILTILNDPDLIETYQAVFQQTPKYTLCPYDRHIRRTVKENSVHVVEISSIEYSYSKVK